MSIIIKNWIEIPRNTYTYGFLGGTVVNNLPANAGGTKDTNSIPEPRRCLGGRNGTYLSILARKIPWTEESGGLQSMGL